MLGLEPDYNKTVKEQRDMANQQNLLSWAKGQSGNPNGRPKGSKNISTRIRDYLESDQKIIYKSNEWRGNPIDLMISVYVHKAIDGDIKAMEFLAKYGYGPIDKIQATSKLLPIPILEVIKNSGC